MYILAELQNNVPVVSLVEPDDCQRFHLTIHGLSAAMAERALEDTHIGRLYEHDNAWINIVALRQMAEGHVQVGWSERFEAMVAYAKRKGWLSDDMQQLRGHCEWTLRS